MKKIWIYLVFMGILYANPMAKNILENVLIKNVNETLHAINSLEKSKSLKQSQEEFGKLVYNWKKIQASFVAGEMNEDFLDTLRFVDIYHEGNEDIKKQLQRIRNSKDKLEIELYKSSHKSINALEFMLFSGTKLTKRDKDIVHIIISSIKSHLEDIKNVYKNDTKKFLNDEKFANSAILNALVSNSYKTYAWRLAEGLGKSKKYKKKDENRFEYSFSKQDINALKGIVDAHIQIVDADYGDFGDMAMKNGANKEIKNLRKLLQDAKKSLNSTTQEELLGKKGEELYKIFKEIYIHYGLYLISALEVTAKIVEADGD